VTELELPPSLNTAAVVLAVVKEAGDQGNQGPPTSEIIQTVLELKKTFDIENIDIFPGLESSDSHQVRNIIVNLAMTGHLKQGNPVQISKKGEAWMNRTLEKQFKNRWDVSWFWLTLTHAREKTRLNKND